MDQPVRSLCLESDIAIPSWDGEKAGSFQEFADEVFAPIYPYICRDIETAWGRSLEARRVLEIGGGPGNMALELLNRGVASLTGLDISEAMLERTSRRLRAAGLEGKFRAVPGEASTLPFAERSFDLVFSRGSIQFWPDIPRALREIARVLSIDGFAFVGGGFGLSTPTEVKQSIHAERNRRMAERPDLHPIPKLNHDEVLACALGIGGKAELAHDGPGHWLLWYPAAK
ncbi:MAG TPA: class I SAM-dependent methyltransferase [Candidatus Ozemobacteraceae bacterium]|nr:class I SAM-dependent methyltransferase [Candidatus Ozemobacteraceae bacterium]